MEEVLSVAPAEVTSEQKQMASMVIDRAYFQRVLLTVILRGNNPRVYFDPIETAEMDESVRTQGVLQPIILRLKDGKYYIVAGERRFRSACNVMYDGYEIPAMVAEMTDEEAHVLSAVENIARVGMSHTEEAAAAANVLGTTKGDRDLAAKMLGWSRGTLDNRLALMNCTPTVRTALNQRQINLGHAELLAALSKSSQEKFLPVIINENRTVAEIKKVIAQAACKLDAAIFEKEDCLTCPHNSSLQKSFFTENIGDGGCTNPACYNEKTENVLNAKVVELKDEYPVVRIVRIGDNSTAIKLIGTGPTGVGEEQARECRGCAEFGAAVSALPDAMGKVYKEQCFNTSCNSKKVAARIAAERPKAVAAGDNSSTPAPTTKADGDIKDLAKEKKVVTSVTVSDRVKAYREKYWRLGMKMEIANDPILSNRYLIALALNNNAGKISGSALSKVLGSLTGSEKSKFSLPECCQAAEALDEVQLHKMTTLLAASAMADLDVSNLQQLAVHHKLDLTKYWKLDSDFLDILTKSEIEVVATELGIHKKFGEGFKKLFADKKDELIKKLLNIDGFDYSAKIPKVLRP